MATARPAAGSVTSRRAPTQQRSRERFARILDAAAALITDNGVAGLSTRAIAARAGIPVASLYQYFADRDEIILALVQRDTAEMDQQVAEAVAALEEPTLRSLITATMRAFVRVYHRRPAFVMIWWRGRTNRAVVEFCRAHNRQIARTLHDYATRAGLVDPEVPLRVAELAVEVGDRVFQVAFERDLRGDPWVIEQGIDLVTGYLERFAANDA
ncbi:TetR/AcrR family transcriptional regulator [Gandjariella thermophila]|uniref:TetR family transcriptional regulator n=1 Tax=Gandjariella thermophila TaxID=1931992 RepID=A0A4D4J5S2_9PSEU|nr:TetR/AcrR family transcriptional regulator [Gandjariella thermophila]GDY30088.1 TetR family transcriptional regulator [Gandjariella thermophila]